MTYRILTEKTPHGTAYVVVGPDGRERLFFDRAEAERYVERKQKEARQGRLDL